MKTKRLIAELKALRDLGQRQAVLADHLIGELLDEQREETPEEAESVDFLDGIPALLDFLRAHNYRAKKSKVYADRRAGLIRMEPDGKSISMRAVHTYIRTARLRPLADCVKEFPPATPLGSTTRSDNTPG